MSYDLKMNRALRAAQLLSALGCSILAAPAQVLTQAQAATHAAAYEAVSNRFWAIYQLVPAILGAFLLLFGLGGRLTLIFDRWCKGRRVPCIALFALSYVLLTQLLRAPISYFWVLAHDNAPGVPRTSASTFLLSQLQELLPLLFGGILVVSIVYWLMRRSPRRWWLYTALGGATLTFILLLLQPFTVVYEPLGSTPIAAKIQALALRAGVPSDRIAVQRADDSTGCGAATVIGLGSTRRMLLDDALIAHNAEGEILETVAHEAKHYVRDDNVKALVMISGWLLCAFWLTYRLGASAISRWGSRLGFEGFANPASLSLIVVILSTAYFVALPAARAFQRNAIEQEADRFALDLTHDKGSEINLYARDLQCYPLLNPKPGIFYQMFRATHPSIQQRIGFAGTYQP
jgi:STE24 endopeptidase